MKTLIWPERVIGLARTDFSPVGRAGPAFRLVRYVLVTQVVEEAAKKSPGNVDLDDEVTRAREDLCVALREKEEAEAEQKLSEAQQHHAFFVKEQHEDRQERTTFRRVSFWQHMATYLLYFVMLLNVFITTFGISSGIGHHRAAAAAAADASYSAAATSPAPAVVAASTDQHRHNVSGYVR